MSLPARRRGVVFFLAACLIVVFFLACHGGSVWLSSREVSDILWRGVTGTRNGEVYEFILLELRLPRLLMAVVVGATLAVSGTVLQGLFRNPLAEPALTGVSAGGALAAAATLAFEITLFGIWSLPLGAVVGSGIALIIALLVAGYDGRLNVTVLLLCGLAINLLATAGIGGLMLSVDNAVLRGFTFWVLGGFGLADAGQVIISVLVLLPALLILMAGARVLNAFILGESGAYYLGFATEWWKYVLIAVVSVAVGVSVAFCGIIAFVGLIAPHIARMLVGAEHRILMPAAALCGAILVLLSDGLARTVALPGELPVGVITGLIGAPLFIAILALQRRGMRAMV